MPAADHHCCVAQAPQKHGRPPENSALTIFEVLSVVSFGQNRHLCLVVRRDLEAHVYCGETFGQLIDSLRLCGERGLDGTRLSLRRGRCRLRPRLPRSWASEKSSGPSCPVSRTGFSMS